MPRRITSSVTDWSLGIIGGISPYKRRVRHFQVAENVLPRPLGAVSVREGSQRFSTATLTKKLHSVMEWVTSAGAGHIFVGCADANGLVFEATAGAFNAQTLPFLLGADVKLVDDQLNGAIWVTENSGANPPMFFRSTNPANTFHTAVLPRPAFMDIANGVSVTIVSGPGTTLPGGTVVTGGPYARGATTFTMSNNAGGGVSGICVLNIGGTIVPNCHLVNGTNVVTYDRSAAAQTQRPFTITLTAGGAMAVGAQPFYRLRYRYLDGSSRETAAFQAGAPTAGANLSYTLTEIVTEQRSDYNGWTLERTKVGGTAAGPFYFVSDGTGNGPYVDGANDADLGYRSSVTTNNGEIHGEPPHFDGILAFKDRLVGWVGSTLWFSQAVADIEATGIANWNPLAATAIGPDDGDTIKLVVRQVDRLVILKRWSVWASEGDDITSFRVFPLPGGAGCAGPRAACAIGSDVYFYGDAGFHRLRGNNIEPFGWEEVGHLFDTFKPGQNADVVVTNYLGQYVLVSFASTQVYNDDMLVYDVRFQSWWRFTGWYAYDMLVQKAGSFGDAQALVTVDRRDFGGGDYRVWLNFYGFKDEKAANGTGGNAPKVTLATPMIDDGAPDTEKDWERIEVFLSGTAVTADISIGLDPQRSASLSVTASASGALWDTPNWDAFNWGTAIDSGPSSGLPAGTAGRRYSFGLVCFPTADMAFKGYSMDGTVSPTKDYSGV